MQGETHSTPVFHCYRCSHCCFFKSESEVPVLLPHEVALLKVLGKRFGISKELVFKRLETGFYRWMISGYCPFYDPANRSCLIHYDKPLACRMYPLVVNLTTMELSVSRVCTWVSRNNEILEKDLENPSAVFPDETKAVYELLEVLGYAASSGFTVVVVEKPEEGLKALVRSPCMLVRVRECSSTRRLYLLYLTGCSGDEVEQVLSSAGVNIVAITEFAVRINQ